MSNLPQAPLPLHARLTESAAAWADIGASGEILQWIHKGVEVRFRRSFPTPFELNYPLPVGCAAAWDALALQYEAQGAIERISEDQAHCVSPAFLVAKRNTTIPSYRLCLDLRRVNDQVLVPKFKYESFHSCRRGLRSMPWLTNFDLQDAFLHLKLSPASRRYFQFRLAGQLWQMSCLPFGFRGSPFYFSKLMKVFSGYVRSPQLFPAPRAPSLLGWWTLQPHCSLLAYLDDFLMAAASHKEAQVQAQLLQGMLLDLGLTWRPSKSDWVPSRRRCHLGLEIDTKMNLIWLPEAKLHNLKQVCNQVLRKAHQHGRMVHKRALASLCGKLQAAAVVIPTARLFLEEIYICMRDQAVGTGWNVLIKLSHAALRSIQFFHHLTIPTCTTWLAPPPRLGCLETDASPWGWGAVLRLPGQPACIARGLWDPSEEKSIIAAKELRAISKALKVWSPNLQAGTLRVYTDNQNVFYTLIKQTARSWTLRREYWELSHLLAQARLLLLPHWIPSSCNSTADALSRQRQEEPPDPEPGPPLYNHTTRLSPVMFQWLKAHWSHTPQLWVDRFATSLTTHSPLYYSLERDPGALGLDGVQGDWGPETHYCFPPTPLLVPLLHDILSCRRGNWVVIVAPVWPSAPFLPLLRQLAARVLYLPQQRRLFDCQLPPWRTAAFLLTPQHSLLAVQPPLISGGLDCLPVC